MKHVKKFTSKLLKGLDKRKVATFVYLVLVILNTGCEEEKQSLKEVEYTGGYNLQQVEAVTFNSTDSLFIGAISNIKVLNDFIYISDRSEKKVHVLDTNMNYISHIGRYGNGPEEFSKAPALTSYGDQIVLHDMRKDKLLFYKKLSLVKIIQLPAKLFYVPTGPIITKSSILLAGANEISRTLNYTSEYRIATLVDSNGNVIKHLCPLPDEYYKNRDLLFYVRQPYGIVSKGFNNTFLVVPAATKLYNVYDYSGNFINSFYYSPKYYRNPPDLKLSEEPKDVEKLFEKYFTKVSYYALICYDEYNSLLLINYRTLHQDEYKTRSFLDADNYLAIINENYEAIYDEKIPGYLIGSSRGKIYILTEESDTKIEVKKYRLLEK